MIDFLPHHEEDFTFTPLYYQCSDGEADLNIARYPFSDLRYFFCNKESLPIIALKIDETKIEKFDMFRNIFMRGDYFYLIAYHYFLNVGNYDYNDKSEGMMKIKNGNGETIKTISYFEPLYQALQLEKNKAKTLLRHEYILSKSKYTYINKLIQLLFRDYNDLDDAIRKEKNVFAKYGIAVKEVYLEIFRDFYSNLVDYLSKENFDTLKKFVYPSNKEVQSFRLAKRKTYRNLRDMTARRMIIESIHINLINTGFISDKTTYEQIDDLFNNKRRELSKIVWLKNVTALFTLYKVMEADKIVEDTEGKHWKILADYFILENDSEISREELKTKKISTNHNLINELISIFDRLKIIVA